MLETMLTSVAALAYMGDGANMRRMITLDTMVTCYAKTLCDIYCRLETKYYIKLGDMFT